MANQVKSLFFEPKPGFLTPEKPDTLSWENESLKPYCKVINLKAGDLLLRSGELPTACYLIKSGIIIASEQTSSGLKRMYNFNQFNPEGILLFDANIELKLPVWADFTAMIDSTVVEIDYASLCAVADQNPEIARQLRYSISVKFFSAAGQMRAINSHPPIWRYCQLILLLAQQTGIETPEGIVIKDTFTQTEMANFLNISRTTLHFECSSLREKGLIIQKKREIIIPSIEKLIAHQHEVSERKEKNSQKKEKKKTVAK